VNLDLAYYLQYSPIAVGVGVGFVVLLLLSRRKKKAAFAPPAVPQSAMNDMDDDQSFSNRRGTVRREGQPVKIVVSSPAFRNKMDSGYVLDRSTGGLRIALPAAVTPGSTMQVRADNAPDTVPWVTVVVRNCRNTGRHFELGCEFDQTPPWNVLLLFG